MSKSNKGVMKRLYGYLEGKYRYMFFAAIAFIIVSTIATLAISLSMKVIIDSYITPMLSSPNKDFTSLYIAILVVAIIFLFGAISSYLYTRIMVYVGSSIIFKLRIRMFEKLQYLPIRYTDNRNTGEIISTYTNDADNVEQFINQTIPSVVRSLLLLVFSLVTMIALSPLLSIFAFVMLFLTLFIFGKLGMISARYFMKQQADIANLTGFVEEYINGLKVIKVFNHEHTNIEEFEKINEKLFHSSSTAQTISSCIGPAVGNLSNLQFVITAIVGGLLAINNIGTVTVGILASYLQLTKSFSNPIMTICQQANFYLMATASAKRIFELIDEEKEEDDGLITLTEVESANTGTSYLAWRKAENNYIKLNGEVRINNMDFSYDGIKPILKNINLYAKPGQKIAFVGATGAGKTTITNLINRLYDINAGEILYDGINIADIKKSSLRGSLGVVLQDTKLFTASIKDNIRYGNLDASDEEVKKAAKLACADSFIELLPDGYDTVITGGDTKLSQGQRQLISIARAAISNPPVLILDEATSNIDSRTETIVQRGMDNLMKGRTVFVIAHRLSTIMNSDLIVVLDKGEIVEKGNHNELLDKKGYYYQLYTGKVELE